MTTYNEQQMAIYDFLVDTLVDMADTPPAEMEEAREDMMSVVSVMFEGLDFKVVGSDEDGILVRVRLSD